MLIDSEPALHRLQLSLICAAAIVSATAAAADRAPEPRSEFDCLIEARQQIAVRSQVEGVIESIRVRRGDVVRKNALLATLAAGPERATLELARARADMQGDVSSAQARVELAKKKWDRAAELHTKNFVSASARDEAEAEYRLAKDQLRAALEKKRVAQLDVDRAKEVLAQRSIRSPINGVVVEVDLRPGELMSSNQKDPIMRIVQVDPLNVELVLPVSQFGKIKAGQRAVVLPEAPVGGKYRARVEVVDPVVDAASGTFGVRLLLHNPGNRIPAGIKCRARF